MTIAGIQNGELWWRCLNCRYHHSACWNSLFIVFFTGKINADINELFLWHSREFSLLQDACQFRKFIRVCLKFAVRHFLGHLRGPDVYSNFLAFKAELNLNVLYKYHKYRVQQVCFSVSPVFFAFFISSSAHEVYTHLQLLSSLKNIAIPWTVPDLTH